MPNPPQTPLEQLFIALPNRADNPVGTAAFNALLTCIETHTPGEHTQPWPQHDGPSFRQIFFPNASDNALSQAVPGNTGLAANFWSDFSVALLCQCFAAIASDIRSQMKSGDINNAVNAHNNALNPKAVGFYAYALQTQFDNVRTALADLPNKAQALTEYQQHLTSNAWVTMKIKQAHDGQWPDPDWELFHHWLKLSLLGASDAQIDAVIRQLVTMELPVDPRVAAGQWRNYFVWFRPVNGSFGFSYSDIQSAATPGIMARICSVYMGSPYPSCMDQENCFEFTANGQPGNGYRQPPGGGSCFTGQSQVLLASGQRMPLSDVRAGMQVMTPQGPQTVAMVATPPRYQRPLFRFEGCDFAFTATHPFLLAAPSPDGAHVAAGSPTELSAMMPGFADLGLCALAGQVQLLEIQGGNPAAGVIAPALYPAEQGATDDSAPLYDLILDPAAQASGYFVGDAQRSFLVSSELPPIGAYPHVAWVVLQVIEHLQSDLGSPLASPADGDWVSFSEEFVRCLRCDWLPRLTSDPADANADYDPSQLPERLSNVLGSMQLDGQYAWQAGLLVERLLQFAGDELMDVMATGWRHIPEAGLPDLPVCVLTVHRLHWLDGRARQVQTMSIVNADGPPLLCLALDDQAAALSLAWHSAFELAFTHGEAVHQFDALKVSLCAGGESFNAILPMLPATQAAWRHQRLLLQAADGSVAGALTLSWRWLNAADWGAEQALAQSTHWDDASQRRFAARLAALIPGHLQECLPAHLHRCQACCKSRELLGTGGLCSQNAKA